MATLCEPRLLAKREVALRVLELLDEITSSILEVTNRRADEFKVLRKALGYGWSVAIVAEPDIGKPRMTYWIRSEDKDIKWIMRQNLKKNRLIKMDANWVRTQLDILEG